MNVSVVIPVFNAEKYISKAIESCLQLTEVKEIVVVDDGYKDNAKEIVRELASKYSIIQLYEHPDNSNKGAGPSRNLGIEKATQEFIAFLDADDFFLPHRFKKDKETFKNNPDADGCYNAIGCHFYSETAKESFLSYFPSTITTVNSKAHPTPENLFGGLIGMIPNYGYFSLDGLTVKRDFLLKNKIMFPALSVHQDTVFIVKLAHYGRLYPSELNLPVSLRGVHEENRITANYQLEKKKKYLKRFRMWSWLYNWAKNENVNKKELKLLKKQAETFRVLSSNHLNMMDLVRSILNHPTIIVNLDYRTQIANYFRNFFVFTNKV